MRNNIINVKLLLTEFWRKHEYIELPEVDIPKGAGTSNPIMLYQIYNQILFNMFGFHRCRRPNDSIFNWKNRLFCHTQCQVITMEHKSPDLLMFINSLKYIFCAVGLKLDDYVLTLWEDDWKQETINAIGHGWEVRLNGIEIAQITYFKKILGKTLEYHPIEFAYGIERLCTVLQNCTDVMKLEYCKNIKYYQIFKTFETEMSDNIEDKHTIIKEIDHYINMSYKYIQKKNLYKFIEYLVLVSHWLNLLEINQHSSIQEYKIWAKKVINLSTLYHENINKI